LEAGRHVVVEKPLVPRSAEADELIRLAERHGRLLSVFHQRRWDGDFLTVQQCLQVRLLGQLSTYIARWDRFRPRTEGGWREQRHDRLSGIHRAKVWAPIRTTWALLASAAWQASTRTTLGLRVLAASALRMPSMTAAVGRCRWASRISINARVPAHPPSLRRAARQNASWVGVQALLTSLGQRGLGWGSAPGLR
jgi:Oxidoreductase family, NAD-binding Rossmann fold